MFCLQQAREISKIIKSINVDKATGPDCNHAKFVRMSADTIDSHLIDIVNCGFSQKY